MDFKKLAKGIFGGSLILLVTFNLFNAINYFFHFVMARMLGAADYGVLATLMSIVYIFNVPLESIQTIVTKYVSHEKSFGKIKNIARKVLKEGFKISLKLFLVYLIIMVFVGMFLKIDYPLLALTGILIFYVFSSPVNRGVLQGKKYFNTLGINMIIEAITKLLFAILLVFLGWKVYGAITGVIIGVFFAFILSFYHLKDVFSSKESYSQMKGIYGYSMPVFTIIFTVMIFFSLDIILAKAFFPSNLAGQYAIASMIAKIIFFGMSPISKAMFPLTSEASNNKKHSRDIFIKSLLILGLGVLVALLIVWFFPDLLVRIFSGQYYPEASRIVFLLAISTSLLSFTNLILLYRLSLGKVRRYWLILVFLIFEAILLGLYHTTLIQFAATLLFLNMLFLFGSIFLFNRK